MTEKKLKICAVTTTRADYGIMRPLLLKLNKADWCDLVLAVTGTHLLKAFGYTIKEIEKENWKTDVWDKQIAPEMDSLYMKPGYTCD